MMKKFISLLCLMAIIALDLHAQGDGKGYKGYVDAGYSIGVGDYDLGRVEINTSHGYQFSPFVFLGAGTGLHFMSSYKTGDMEIPLDVRDSQVDVPVFANVRAHFCKGKVAPFVDLKGGTYVTNGGRLYANVSAGVRWALNDKQGISLSVGYASEKLKFEVFDSFYDHDDMDYTRIGRLHTTEAVTVKLGLDF